MKNDLLSRAFAAVWGSRGPRQEVTFVVQDDGPVGLDGVRVRFDDERVVSDAGVMLVATLAQWLGIEALAARLVCLRGDRPGASNVGRKVMALVYAMVLGADCIDDCDVLRAGRTRRLLGGWLPAPSTLGTFLRAFTFGHVRQLDRVLAETLTRAWQAGAGPGDRRLVVDVDSFVGEVHGYGKQGAAFGYTRKRGYHPILASRADTGETPAHPPAQGLGEHRQGRAAVRRGADRARHTGRRDRPQAVARRLGVLEQEADRPTRAGRLAVLDRRPAAGLGAGRDRPDPRHRLATAGRLPRRRRGADRPDDGRRPTSDRAPHPADWPAGRAVAGLATLRVCDKPQRTVGGR